MMLVQTLCKGLRQWEGLLLLFSYHTQPKQTLAQEWNTCSGRRSFAHSETIEDAVLLALFSAHGPCR